MLCPWKKTMLIRSIGGTTLSVYFEKCGGSEDEVFRRAYAELLKITVTVFPLDRKFMEICLPTSRIKWLICIRGKMELGQQNTLTKEEYSR
jgi:hypothetical protein